MSRPRWTLVLVIAAILIVGSLDYVTGFELSFGIFYLIPVVLAAWVLGLRAGLLVSVFCSCVWLAVDVASGHPYSSVVAPLWNAGVRLGFFLGFAYLTNQFRTATDALKTEKDHLEMRVQERTAEFQKAEKEARALRQRIELILGITKTGLDIIDSQFNLRYVDPSWAETYGDPAGKKCYQYFVNRSEPCPGCGIPEALRTRNPVVTEERLSREGNRLVQVTSVPFQDERGEWLVAEVNVDITERNNLEEQLRQAQKLEAIGRLAGGVAHDFNNQLIVIGGYTNCALRKVSESDPIREHLDEVRNATLRAETLTRQLLAFGRKRALQPKILDLNALIADMNKMLRPLIGEDIELVTILKP
ncbi:MAG: PAS domain-containing protein, partial [bacterium]